MDITGEEFKTTYLSLLPIQASSAEDKVVAPTSDVDWVKAGAVTGVKD